MRIGQRRSFSTNPQAKIDARGVMLATVAYCRIDPKAILINPGREADDYYQFIEAHPNANFLFVDRDPRELDSIRVRRSTPNVKKRLLTNMAIAEDRYNVIPPEFKKLDWVWFDEWSNYTTHKLEEETVRIALRYMPDSGHMMIAITVNTKPMKATGIDFDANHQAYFERHGLEWPNTHEQRYRTMLEHMFSKHGLFVEFKVHPYQNAPRSPLMLQIMIHVCVDPKLLVDPK